MFSAVKGWLDPNQANQASADANYHNICRTLQGGSSSHWGSLIGRVNSCHQRHTTLRAWRHSVKSIWLNKFIHADIITFYKRRLLPNPNQAIQSDLGRAVVHNKRVIVSSLAWEGNTDIVCWNRRVGQTQEEKKGTSWAARQVLNGNQLSETGKSKRQSR